MRLPKASENKGEASDGKDSSAAKGLKVTVNLTPRADQALRNLLPWTNGNKTDAINQALVLYSKLRQLNAKGDLRLVIEDGDTRRELEFIWP